ncbi:MAG: hypothetical protein IJ228_11445 [Succinivibrio sp.]|nr:hypothetical protein [Succinivibrio sp.]
MKIATKFKYPLFVFSLLFLGAVLLLLSSRNVKDPFLPIDTLQALERHRGERVLLSFSTAGCGSCRRVSSKIFSSPYFIDEAAGMALLRIDISDAASPLSEAVRELFGVQGAPALVLLDEQGQLRGRLGEIKNVHEVVELIHESERRDRLSAFNHW